MRSGKLKLLVIFVLLIGAVSGSALNGRETKKQLTPAELELLHRLRRSADSMPVSSQLAATASSQVGSNVALKLALKKQANAGGHISPQVPANQPIAATGVAGRQIGGGSVPMASRNAQSQSPSGRHSGITKGQAPATSKQVRRAANIKLRPLKFGPRITNPQATQADAAIVAVLQKQKQAADSLAALMKAAQLGGNMPAARPQLSSSPGAKIDSRLKAPATTNIQKGSAPGNIGPEKPFGAPGNPSPSFARLSQIDTTVATCTYDPTMRILKVSGWASPATFSPDAKYNFYTITGCSFGDQGSFSDVHIYGGGGFSQHFQIQEWHENWINLNLDSSLSGMLDQDNLTLVVRRADGKETSKNGFKFYAARETTRLSSIPQKVFSLNQFTLNDTSHLQPTYISPSSAHLSPSAASEAGGIPGYTAEVFWGCSNCFAEEKNINPVYMKGNEDIYQLKELQPGFAPESASLAYRNIDCGEYTLHTEGNFDLRWVGDELHVPWQGQTCVAKPCGGSFQPDCFQINGSLYAVDVWVTGPRGVDPWTGKPAAMVTSH